MKSHKHHKRDKSSSSQHDTFPRPCTPFVYQVFVGSRSPAVKIVNEQLDEIEADILGMLASGCSISRSVYKAAIDNERLSSNDTPGKSACSACAPWGDGMGQSGNTAPATDFVREQARTWKEAARV